MERDFLGLGSKNLPITVKDETPDASKDSASVRGSGMQLSFSNKVSAIPQFLSFKHSLEDKPRNTVFDSMPSSGYMSISTAEAFGSNQKSYGGIVQKNATHDKQTANPHGMTTYATVQRYDVYPVHRPQGMRTFPVSNQQNQTITVSMSTPVLQSHFASSGHNIVGNPGSVQPLGGVPVLTPVSVLPTTNPLVGTTDLRNSSKTSGAPAQLTIFYAGSVCVYDDVSPEKAQAIMLLAGNGSPATQNMTLPTAQTQASPDPKPSVGDSYVGNKNSNVALCSGLPSPVFVTKCSLNELSIPKPRVTLASSINQTEPPKPINSVAPAPATLGPAVAVPQARKASLARFLEKRKERVMNASPYSVSKKSPDYNVPGSDSVSLSINSSSSFPLPATN
ncbi:hypothetical protein K2173_027126 [Erythroxylum novogranatense]|uniref:Protein TIFY n=1 Tax=Erythroxylum novogranatense TaxID=1862640 RepID=A0AAV8U101_9ROSI|nr:hypothetical protein K2173_027126 [Erythroxylum novogranatense]